MKFCTVLNSFLSYPAMFRRYIDRLAGRQHDVRPFYLCTQLPSPFWHATEIIDQPTRRTRLTVSCVNKTSSPVEATGDLLLKYSYSCLSVNIKTRIFANTTEDLAPLLSESTLQVDGFRGRTRNRRSGAREVLFNRLKLSGYYMYH
jgi:hypothetical protein